MTRLLPHVALLALLLCAWVARVELGPRRALPGASPYAALDDAESSYRLRAVELTLASGRAPRSDAYLGPDDPELAPGVFPPLPFPPLVHAGLALIAKHALGDDAGPRELGGIEEPALEAACAQVPPVLGMFAVAAAFAACAALASGPRRAWGAIAAAALIALTPTAIAGEALGSLRAQPWIEIASFGALAGIAFALRAREQVDTTLGSMFAGVGSALALLAGFEAWPLPVAILGVLIALALRRPRAQARDAWRAVTLFTAVTAAIVAIAEPGGSFAFAAPDFSGGLQLPQLAFAGAGLPFAWIALFPRRRDPLHALLLALSFLAFACALFDARFHALVHVSLAASVALLVGEEASTSARGWNKHARQALALVVVLGAASAWLRGTPLEPATKHEFVDGLRWLRANSSSPGPFNNADAHQEWRVWSAPALAGSIAYHARRPVLAASIGGRSAPREPQLAVADELLAHLDANGALYVVATPCMLRDPALIGPKIGPQIGPGEPDARSALAHFALGRAEAAPAGWERAWACASNITPSGAAPTGAELAGPVVSIWRRVSALPRAGAGATVR